MSAENTAKNKKPFSKIPQKQKRLYCNDTLGNLPDQKTEAYINWRGKLKTKTVDTKTAVEMYSDTEGGYLAVLDWDTKTVSEYEN